MRNGPKTTVLKRIVEDGSWSRLKCNGFPLLDIFTVLWRPWDDVIFFYFLIKYYTCIS